MKNLLLVPILLLTQSAYSQFYYNDIISTADITRRLNDYVTNKVSTVTATATDAYGTKNNSFYELHEVKENGKLVRVSRLDEAGKKTTVYRFGNNGQLQMQVDSANGVKDVTIYKYDANNRIVSVMNTASDTENEFNQIEEHVWIYDENGSPKKMWKIINNRDSLGYEFALDEKKKVADEHLSRNGVAYDPLYYYYYDELGRLSDIARYNKIANRILPDFIFTYDEKNRIIQKLATVPGASTGYVTIRYGFNEQGLKTKEVMFNRLKEKTGTIDFTYTFSN